MNASTDNTLVPGGGEIPVGTKFNFYNCPDPGKTVLVTKVVDYDCDGEMGQWNDYVLENWEFQWTTEIGGTTVSGTVLTDANGQASFTVPSGAQEIFVSEDPNNTITGSNGLLLDYEAYDDLYTQSIIIDAS